MRRSVTRALSVVLMFFVFVSPVSFFGQTQKSEKPARSSSKEAPEAGILHTDEGPAIRVPGHIKKERRTPSAAGRVPAEQDDSRPVETPAFRVMSHPREDRLVRGRPFHGDLRALPQIPPIKFERPEFEEPRRTPVSYQG